jgi:hypothetical protein
VTGYAFLLPPSRDLERARQIVAHAPAQAQPLGLGYDAADPLARAVAERIAVNARDAGLQFVPGAARPDARLVRLPIGALGPQAALTGLASALGISDRLELPVSAPVEALYLAERGLVEDFRVVPIAHLPHVYASSGRLHAWRSAGIGRAGNWRLDDLWLDPERP